MIKKLIKWMFLLAMVLSLISPPSAIYAQNADFQANVTVPVYFIISMTDIIMGDLDTSPAGQTDGYVSTAVGALSCRSNSADYIVKVYKRGDTTSGSNGWDLTHTNGEDSMRFGFLASKDMHGNSFPITATGFIPQGTATGGLSVFTDNQVLINGLGDTAIQTCNLNAYIYPNQIKTAPQGTFSALFTVQISAA